MNEKPYLLVDLDGTLAEFTTWQGIEHIGPPVKAELEYIQGMIAAGARIKIFTARLT